MECLLNSLHRGLFHDPENFEDPMTFKPERYLKDGKINPDILDPMVATFGFGRRSVQFHSLNHHPISPEA
jgi:hypothetical protein